MAKRKDKTLMKKPKRLYVEYIVYGLFMLCLAALVLSLRDGFRWSSLTRLQFSAVFFAVSLFSWFACTYARRRIDRIHRAVNRLIENLPDQDRRAIELDPLNYTPEYFLDKLLFIEERYLAVIDRLKALVARSGETNRQLERTGIVRESIIRLTHDLLNLQGPDSIFDRILTYAIDSIEKAEVGSILILEENNTLRFAASKGFNHEALSQITLDLRDSFLWRKTQGRIEKAIIVEDAFAFNRDHLDPDLFEAFVRTESMNFETTLSAPILVEGRLYGMLNIDSTRKRAFNGEDLALMDYFASQAGLAIKNHTLVERVYHLSRYDDLTGLYNRRHFEDLLALDIRKAARYDVRFLLAVFDLDGLKQINDTLGHLAGDRCLSYFAETTRELFRRQDLFARYGGDEFIAAFYQCDKRDLTDRLDALRRHFTENPCRHHDVRIPLSFSFGLAEFPADGKTYESLLEKADRRMYEAKRRVKDPSAGKDTGSQEGTDSRSE